MRHETSSLTSYDSHTVGKLLVQALGRCTHAPHNSKMLPQNAATPHFTDVETEACITQLRLGSTICEGPFSTNLLPTLFRSYLRVVAYGSVLTTQLSGHNCRGQGFKPPAAFAEAGTLHSVTKQMLQYPYRCREQRRSLFSWLLSQQIMA